MISQVSLKKYLWSDFCFSKYNLISDMINHVSIESSSSATSTITCFFSENMRKNADHRVCKKLALVVIRKFTKNLFMNETRKYKRNFIEMIRKEKILWSWDIQEIRSHIFDDIKSGIHLSVMNLNNLRHLMNPSINKSKIVMTIMTNIRFAIWRIVSDNGSLCRKSLCQNKSERSVHYFDYQ